MAVIASDFNASVIWDKEPGVERFATVDDEFQSLRFASAYHAVGQHAFGREGQGTLFWRKKLNRLYHIDYSYLSTSWIPHVRSVEIGTATDWLRYSGRAPVVVDLELAAVASPS